MIKIEGSFFALILIEKPYAKIYRKHIVLKGELMNITNLEITQAAINMFFCLVCIVMATFIRANNPKNKSMKSFIRLFFIAAALFFGETLAYIFRGNVRVFDVAVTRVANALVFAMNVLMAITFVKYVKSIFNDRGIEVSKNYERVVYALSIANMIIIVVNLFYPWMYYFDKANYYHRKGMWYVYTVVSIAAMLVGALMAMYHRKSLEVRSFISVMLFSFIPIIATFMQLFIYGISMANIGLGIGALIMFAAYIYDWAHDDTENIERIQKTRFDVVFLFVIMLLCMSAAIVACTNVIQRVAKENSEMQSETIAQMVSTSIENEFIKPITVAKTVSQNLEVRSYISGKTRADAKAVEGVMARQLMSVGNGLGYHMVFAVSEKSRAYYTYNGISKYLDIENDGHDVWYKDLLETSKTYIVNVDTDEDNNWALSVFVNYKILDDAGNMLGACGVGVDMNDLLELMAGFEKAYDIKVDLVDRNGLIQIDSDASSIEARYLNNSYFEDVTGSDFYYQQYDGYSYMTKYIDELDWYLVVRDNHPVKINIYRIIIPIVLIFIMGVNLMVITFAVISIREKKAEEAYKRRYVASIKDEMTGLYNRRGFEADCEAIAKENSLSQYSIIMMDLNGLKSANDNLGHEAGDELIIGAAKCMNNAFSGLGDIYRVGGDEFVALLKGEKEDIYAAANAFDHLTANFKGELVSELSVSKGIVLCEEHPELAFSEAKALADKLMYEDKDEYYRRTGKNRRRV